MKFSKQMVPFKSFLDRFNKSLGPKRQELIAQKDNNIEELQKSIQEDEQIADYETEDQTIRERERERITEKRQQIDALENEREKNLKKALHQERMRTHSRNTVLQSQPGSWNNNRSDCEFIDKRLKVCCQSSRRLF